MDLSQWVRDVPDFPKEGIVFKDITPLLKDRHAYQVTLDRLIEPYVDRDINYVCGIESRGFIFGSAVAHRLNAGFIPIRKIGKLPGKTKTVEYDLEYGSDHLQIHEDALQEGNKVLMIDDLLATGGTMEASCELVESLGAKVEACCFVVELTFLEGREKLEGYEILSLLQY